jgi:hypothetical protein
MYLVDQNTFIQFLKNKNRVPELLPETPERSIFEIKTDENILAKIEVYSPVELKQLLKFGKTTVTPKNKYWIRGNEWGKDGNGNFIDVLTID